MNIFLECVSDAKASKCLSLFPNKPLTIGRQIPPHVLPKQENGVFDSKVLSRHHAELWAQDDGRVFIRDLNSSNGTFVNGKSIRQEGRVGDPVSLSSRDTIEFGVDIPDDNGAILYKRVICKIVWAQERRTANADLAEFEALSSEDKLQAILKLVESEITETQETSHLIDEVKAGHLTELLGGTRGSLSKFNKSTGDLQKAVQNSQTTLAGLAAEQVRMKKFVEKWAETLDTLKVENGLIRKDLHMAQRDLVEVKAARETEKAQHALEIGQMETLINSISSQVTELKALIEKQSKDHSQIFDKLKGQQQFIGKEVETQSKSIQDLQGDQTRLASHLDSIGPTFTLKKPVTSSSIPYLLLFTSLIIGGVAVTQDNGTVADYFLKLKQQLFS